ncbi:MAG: hypothetical protein IKL80_01725, partial [Clostridia bacterium]|nr:hypothetical protein [Clostridia bacterium]
MTLKTSFFNKGIYKSTVRRYLWGAVLYLIVLLTVTVLPIVLSIDPDMDYRSIEKAGKSLLYNTDMMVPSVTIAMFVSVVVGLLVFRFVHSKKSSIFTHSLPVSRVSIYLSTLAASFTLMVAP